MAAVMESVIAFGPDQSLDSPVWICGDFAAVVERHERMVFSIAMNMLGRPSEAEDLSQEVFLQLYRHLAEIESDSHLLHWLRRVTTNRCIDHMRRNRITSVSFDSIPEPPSSDRAPDPLLPDTLRTLMATLPPAQRALLVLRYQEELGPGEIASVMGVPLSTVKSNLHRALNSLRKKVNVSSRRVV
ncbi:MAG: sigma-70 family RNA polymerase sigma factor [Acidobacteriota bacterium]